MQLLFEQSAAEWCLVCPDLVARTQAIARLKDFKQRRQLLKPVLMAVVAATSGRGSVSASLFGRHPGNFPTALEGHFECIDK